MPVEPRGGRQRSAIRSPVRARQREKRRAARLPPGNPAVLVIAHCRIFGHTLRPGRIHGPAHRADLVAPPGKKPVAVAYGAAFGPTAFAPYETTREIRDRASMVAGVAYLDIAAGHTGTTHGAPCRVRNNESSRPAAHRRGSCPSALTCARLIARGVDLRRAATSSAASGRTGQHAADAIAAGKR